MSSFVPRAFFESLEASRFRVARPKPFIFLCGGVLNEHRDCPPSAREGLLRSLRDRHKFNDHLIVLAEDVDTFYPDSPYGNLIEFEMDIARISDSVILISEGIGSFAELGAFSQIMPIAERMMVIIRSDHYDNRSFIRDGPIRHLEDLDESSIQAFPWRTNRIQDDEEFDQELDQDSFNGQVQFMRDAIAERLARMPETMTFSSDNFGHKIIVAAVVCDIYGAAKFSEVKDSLEQMEIAASDDDVHRMLFCGRAVDWIRRERIGNTYFYLPNFEKHACHFRYRAGSPVKDMLRWKSDFRDHWQRTDKRRWTLIAGEQEGEDQNAD